MQTFLPYADFAAASAVLDDRRLGKQRVESYQILRALTWPTYAWKNHPAVRMWRGFVPALVAYGLANCAEWTRRGRADTVAASLLVFTGGVVPDVTRLGARGQLPPWLGLPALHRSHQSALVRKHPAYYRPQFPDVPDDLPYEWPPAAFPRWPVRRRADRPLDLAGALAVLGYEAPRPGQAESVALVQSGEDVLASLAAGSGGTTTGLLAGLCTPGRTLWVSAYPGGGGAVPPRGVPAQPPAATTPARDAAPPTARPRTERPPTARLPTAAEEAAMAEESAAVPEFHFHRAVDLRRREVLTELRAARPGLVVVDLTGAPGEPWPAAGADLVAQAREGLGHPPLLVLTSDDRVRRPADDVELAARLRLSSQRRHEVRTGRLPTGT